MKRNGKPDKRAALKLTLRQCLHEHYPKDDLAERTIKKLQFDLLIWERLAADPAIGAVTDDMLESFRKAALAEGYAPSTVNGVRRTLRQLFRRMGPAITGNPTGISVLQRIPHMRPSKIVRGLPTRVSQEALSRWYLACEQMQSPQWGGPPSFWWQAWLVVCYFTGLRKGDMFAIRFSDLDLDEGTLRFTARKTQKPMRLPLHPCAVEHLRRMAEPRRELVFKSSIQLSGSFNRRWKSICRKADLPEVFTPHDIRRTAASEIERVKAGMGSVLLQHAVNDTTHVSYLNQMEELAEAIAAMRTPLAFRHGPRQAERQLAKQRETAQALMKAAQFSPPSFPDPAEWQFHNVGFAFRGHHVRMEGGALKILKALALSAMHSCTIEELKAAVWPDGPPGSFRTVQGRICDCISTIRERLRHALLLPDSFNPCPCIERGGGGRWTLYIPGEAGKGAA